MSKSLKSSFFFLGLFLISTVSAAPFDPKTLAACQGLKSFYWEIGNVSEAVMSGSVGDDYERDTVVKIASASKLIFGAYVIEKKQGKLDNEDKALLRMQSGFVNFKPLSCALRRTVEKCFEAGSNNQIDQRAVGKFFYNGGHAQALAMKMGLGKFTSNELAQEINQSLNHKVRIDFGSPSPAGGMKASAAEYARFLQSIMKGELKIKSMMGTEAVCTHCPQAMYSPVEEDFDYSWHHWVEKDAHGKQSVFNSAGLFGFYPWVSADFKWYGIVSRDVMSATSAHDSYLCGKAIREEFLKTIRSNQN